MKKIVMTLILTSATFTSLKANETPDSLPSDWNRMWELNEVVIVGKKRVLKQEPDKIVYLVTNDPFAKALNCIEVLDRIPRVSVINENVEVAGKTSVRYILDGHLLESTEESVLLQLRNIPAENIEKIEILTTPPAKYAASPNVAFISIVTRNESFGTRGNVWGNLAIQEKLNYRLGGSVSHTTRKFEFSVDAGWQDVKGINQLDRDFIFATHTISSRRSTHYHNKNLGANALLKHKFNERLSIGGIFNFITDRFKSNLEDITRQHDSVFLSKSYSPVKPNNAITATAFADWKIDEKGKLLSMTYNYFHKNTESESNVETSPIFPSSVSESKYLNPLTENENSSIKDRGKNLYEINSLKLDAIIPFPMLKFETGVVYTGIRNNTKLQTRRISSSSTRLEESLITNLFNYSESTFGLYASIEKQFSNLFYAKAGVRYEFSNVEGKQDLGFAENNYSFGRILPTIVMSFNAGKSGRLSMSYSMGISRPNFNDLNPFKYYTTTTDYFSGNPDLRPSVSHNSEINYSHNGIYAVLYNSYNHNAIGYVSRFNTDGTQFSMPENFIDSNKTGLYVSYNRFLFSWWSIKAGGEIFYSIAKSNVKDFKIDEDKGWSGKIEATSSWMLNRQKTLIFNVSFSHYFPYRERMVNYESFTLFGCDLRYAMLNDRLNLSLSVREPFGWNITKTKTNYQDYTLYTSNDIHAHTVSFRVSYSFGRNKVNNVYRDTKERESSRTY